jgi:hypothetical protein
MNLPEDGSIASSERKKKEDNALLVQLGAALVVPVRPDDGDLLVVGVRLVLGVDNERSAETVLVVKLRGEYEISEGCLCVRAEKRRRTEVWEWYQ